MCVCMRAFVRCAVSVPCVFFVAAVLSIDVMDVSGEQQVGFEI